MHRQFRSLLPDAIGSPMQVLVVFIDIRGFSNFSRGPDQSDIGRFATEFYTWLLDRFGSLACFWKPTGDGLLLAVRYDAQSLKQKADEVVTAALACCKDFPNFVRESAVRHLPRLPIAVGCGVACGTVARLHRRSKTLDIAGHVVNRAARLTAEARPGGVIVDAAVLHALRDTSIAAEFKATELYLPGVAESEAERAGVHAQCVELRPECLTVRGYQWYTVHPVRVRTFSSFLKLGPSWQIDLAARPSTPEDIGVQIDHPSRDAASETAGSGRIQTRAFFSPIVTSHEVFGWPCLIVNVSAIADALRRSHVVDADLVRVVVRAKIPISAIEGQKSMMEHKPIDDRWRTLPKQPDG